ncbi:aldose epimerase family protein [Alkalicoccus daliensis]|uniref:Aldose 1-epimerase n=1 Tax=Alkalicoccus daliensis TaxID=745820 RepID=A0A1H0I7W9_9BACI|nr:aldose epimerase family protein [Alkalicoccus daliensis]SDO27529.1 aldose 1-epimerase [Alkalicoccus daliensis]
MKKLTEIQGRDVVEYTLTNKAGMKVTALNFGAVITGMHVPDGEGNLHNTVLAYDNPENYADNSVFFGAAVGRTSGRTKDAQFELDGSVYELAPNDGSNNLHGGKSGFTHRFFEVEQTENKLKFSYDSPDGEEGFPGNVALTITYSLTERNELHIDYAATTDKATPLNLTNHSYFNLGDGDITDHTLQLSSDYFYELDEESIPVKKQSADNNPVFDFREPKKIKEALYAEDPQIAIVQGGIDHPFELNSGLPAAILKNEQNDITLTIETDNSAIVVYTGNMLGEEIQANGRKLSRHSAVCLETQHVPDDIPGIILRPEEKYEKRTTYRFTNTAGLSQ